MSWASWANRAYVVGAGLAVSAAALLILPTGSGAAPAATPTPTPTPSTTLLGGLAGLGGLGGLDVSVGGINISVLGSSGSTSGSTSASGGTLGGVVGSTLNGVLGSVLGNGRPPTTVHPAPTRPVVTPTPTPVPSSPTATPVPTPVTSTQSASHPHTSRAPAGASKQSTHPTSSAHGTSQHVAATSDVRTRPSGRRSGPPAVVHFAPAAPARHRTQSVADSVLDSALHPGDVVLMLAGITAIVAIGIAAMVVSFGRRPGVSITGQMTE